MSNLHLFDLIVIAGYFLVLLGIGYWAARREKNVSADYFLASRDVGWFAVGASLFASNIGSEHLVGLAGTGAASGLAVGHFEWLACLILLLLGWLFTPFYLRSGVYTMPEFLERRFNPAARTYFTWVSVIGYVLTKISVTLYAGGVVIRAVTGWDFYTAAIVLIVVTGLYTIFGGLRAVVYTEVLQAIVLILGSVTLMSSLASAFNACSTLLTWDVYRKMRPTASEQQLVRVGRISAAVMVFMGLLWIPFMKYVSSQIYIYLQSVQAYIAPPIAACFLLGLFYRRLNGSGAIASLLTGLVLGVLRLVLELTNKASGGLEPGTLWQWIATINFLHFAVLLFVICTVVLFVVSLMTPPPGPEKTEGLTYTYGKPAMGELAVAMKEGETAGARRFEIGLSVFLAILLGVLWIVFR